MTAEELRRGHLTTATLLLCADGESIRYPVKIRLASRSTGVVEVALADIPAEARLRLRHASSGSPASPRPPFPHTSGVGGGAVRERRLALPGSAPVRELTRSRQTVFSAFTLPETPRADFQDRVEPREVTSPEEVKRPRTTVEQVRVSIAVLALVSALLIVLAAAYILHG